MSERVDEIGFGGLKLIQDTDMFCYGIDAVLLASFASRSSHKNVAEKYQDERSFSSDFRAEYRYHGFTASFLWSEF